MSERWSIRKRLAAMLLVATIGCTVYIRPPAGAVFVVREPPPIQREVIIVRPGPAHVWIAGYWTYRTNDYVWLPGRWALPPSGFRAWEAGRWYHERRGWYWIDGHWR